ncbi:MAG: UDP-N-acetylmuramoyl-L-alanine--D-glutamate ligase [Candidatus Cloacimonetes bacterium]|nr:UDP-N-acetylmuramoyl-L-alanine--D-glutamate ligase [Candidatus Cloacimonadota bacterium]MBS3766648.1 UDP-N-acetylmuramoyl-L-alanine--D-glutamate ligase [Candidatus Cloacimonadota bacterium]
MEFKDKRIAVLGLARSGKAAAQKLQNLGAEVFISDCKPEKKLEVKQDFLDKFSYETGGHSEKILQNKLIVVSPGVPSDLEILEKARRQGVPVWSELELGYQMVKNSDVKIIAVTGSNGKSTTASLIYHIFKRAGKKVVLAGNIGNPLTGFSLENEEYEFIILEVSSFQLQNITNFKPNISILLNLTPDHLNRHGTVDNYYRVKAKIFSNQDKADLAILNADDEEVMKLAYRFPVKKVKYSLKTPINNYVKYQDDNLKIVDKYRGSEFISKRDLPLTGDHNIGNINAAALACIYSSLKADQIRSGILTFKNLEHRLEPVLDIDYIKFINDSKATNSASVFCAINSFEKPLHLIMGGSDKDEDFTVLKKSVKEKVKNLIVLGQTAAKLEKIFSDFVPVHKVDSLKAAVKKAFELAQAEEVVLLAPGCASFDMFKDFEDRGEQFKKIVHDLK